MPYKDPGKQRAYMEQYRAEHREEKKRWCAENREKLRGYHREYMRKHRAEKPWLRHLADAKTRCTNPSIACYKYYGGKGIRMLLTLLEVELLWKRDHADQMERPSIDRINPRGDYIFGNCQFIEHSENCRKAAQERWNGNLIEGEQ